MPLGGRLQGAVVSRKREVKGGLCNTAGGKPLTWVLGSDVSACLGY